MNKILPKNVELYQYAKDVLDKNGICYWNIGQYRFEDLLINVHLSIQECIQFNSDEQIIDGFVNSDIRNFLYHNKSFYELLGGKLSHNELEQIASPIEPSLYKVEDDFIQIQPYDVISNLI